MQRSCMTLIASLFITSVVLPNVARAQVNLPPNCAQAATAKMLAGAALASFLRLCVEESLRYSPECHESASAQALVGAARIAHLMQCVAQARQPDPARSIQAQEAERARRAAEVREQQKLRFLADLAQNIDDCERYDIEACYRISKERLPVPGYGVAQSLDLATQVHSRFNKALEAAELFQRRMSECSQKSRIACTSLLALPQLTPAQRSRVNDYQRALPWFDLDDPQHFMTGLILIIPLGGFGFWFLTRRSPANRSRRAAEAGNASPTSLIDRARALITDAMIKLGKSSAESNVEPGRDTGSTAQVAPEPSAPRDPVTARHALALGYSYLQEIPEPFDFTAMEDANVARNLRTTLALAATQLDIAQKADATVEFVLDPGEGPPLNVPQRRLRARLVHLEALTWSFEKPSREIKLLAQATTIDPTYMPAFFALGQAQFGTRNRAAAIAAFQSALALDPGNIEIEKALDRARNMSDAEIAAFKLTQTAARAASAGFRTWSVLKVVFAFVPALIVFALLMHFTGSVSETVRSFAALVIGLPIMALMYRLVVR